MRCVCVRVRVRVYGSNYIVVCSIPTRSIIHANATVVIDHPEKVKDRILVIWRAWTVSGVIVLPHRNPHSTFSLLIVRYRPYPVLMHPLYPPSTNLDRLSNRLGLLCWLRLDFGFDYVEAAAIDIFVFPQRVQVDRECILSPPRQHRRIEDVDLEHLVVGRPSLAVDDPIVPISVFAQQR